MAKMIAGVFGAGRIGKFHVENLLKEGITVKTICDINADQLKDWANGFGIKMTKEEKDIFGDKEINTIFIFSSTNFHVPLMLKAAESVKYIFCEKPVSMDIQVSLDGWKKLSGKDVQIQIGFNRRFDPSFAKVQKMIADKKIGDINVVKITSRDPEPPGLEYVKVSGGIFMDMAIHDFDMARFLSNQDVKEVNVMGGCLVNPEIAKCGDVDTATIQMKFANGTFGLIDISRKAIYGYDQRIEAFGSKGVLKADNQIVNTVTYQAENGALQDNPPYFFIERYMNAYVNEYKSFIAAFENKKPVECSLKDGIKAQLIAVACKKSLDTGLPVKVEELK